MKFTASGVMKSAATTDRLRSRDPFVDENHHTARLELGVISGMGLTACNIAFSTVSG
jgi:hypothetical protein